jgi:hypothetical protein
VSQASTTDTLRVTCVPQASTTDTLRVTSVPQEAGSVPQVQGRASRISTCVPLASSCVSQGMPTVPFGATKEGSPFDVRASRSNECVATLADCAARPNDRASRRSHSASTSDLRCAPRSDCVSTSDLRASPHSESPLWSLRSARSPRLACLSFERMRRSARRPTRNSKLAPLWAVLATSKPLVATSNSLRATPSSCRTATSERLAALGARSKLSLGLATILSLRPAASSLRCSTHYSAPPLLAPLALASLRPHRQTER